MNLQATTSDLSVITKYIPAAGEKQVQFNYSEKSGEVSAYVIDKLGTKNTVKPENMPREVKQIKNSDQFRAFFSQAWAQVSLMSNGDYNLYIHQRGKGGGGGTVVDEKEDPYLVNKIMTIVRKGREDLIKMKIRESVVLLAGRTGAGKSLLGNFVWGAVPLKVCTYLKDPRFEVDHPIFPISHSNTKSCTEVPGVHSPSQKDFSVIDLPGLDDTDPVKDIANLFFRKEVLKDAEQMKIILVVDWLDINRRSNHFSETFNELFRFLGFTDVKDSRLARLAKSLILVVTHAPPDENNSLHTTVKETLSSYLTTSDLKDNIKSVLRKIIEDNRWETFSSPTTSGTAPKVNDDRSRIAALLHETKSQYLSKNDTTIQTKVSEKHEGMIHTGLLTLVANIKEHFAGKILNEFNEHLKKVYTTIQDKKGLTKFQKKYNKIINSDAPCTLSELLKNLEFCPGVFSSTLLKEAAIHDESIKFLVDLLPEKLTNKISDRRDWLGELGLRKTLLKWDEILVEMTKDATLKPIPTTSSTLANPKFRLVLQGYFPRLSQIKNELSKYKNNIEEIEIHALHTVTLDDDLSGDEMRGVNVSIIAPKWKVVNKRVINLTGMDCKDSYAQEAPSGVALGESGHDGEAGLPGENGGHFFGFGTAFSGIDNLTVISNGGKGGTGQKGGKGQIGKDGDDGNQLTGFVPLFPLIVVSIKMAHEGQEKFGWDFVQRPPFHHGNGTYDQELRNYGKEGQAGGNGGKGGQGGFGGQPGSIEFISLNTKPIAIQTTQKVGATGDVGEGGEPQLGGLKGRDWKGTWHTGDNPPCGWNGWEHPHFTPDKKEQCPRASSGTKPTTQSSKTKTPQHALKSFNAMEHLYRYREFAIRESNPLTLEAMELFRKIYDQHSSITGKESIDNFIAECNRMEDFFVSRKDKTKCLPLYLWMKERLQAFTPAGNPNDEALHQCLYTNILSKICQIRAAMDSRLIIDIKGFLKNVGKNIDTLKQLDHVVKVAFYESQYLELLKGKINEADVFLKKLSDDIKTADAEIDSQIKKLLKEVQDLESRNYKNKKDIEAKREELRAQIQRRKMLGFISIAAQAIGCCFPPSGPIVAGVVGAGINIFNNPRNGVASLGQALSAYTSGMQGVLQNYAGALTKAHNTALTRLKDVAFTSALLDVVDTAKTEEEQLKAMDKAIEEIDKQQKQLDSFRNNVCTSLQPSMHDFVDGASKMQQTLKDQSKISLEFSRLAVKRAFESVKRQLKELTKAFTTGDGFLTIIQQLEEAIETSTNLYEYIQEYEEHRTLVSYLARLAATTATDPRIDVYKQKIQRNLILEQYARAMTALRQWAFPFASFYLGDLAVLKQFSKTTKIDDLINLITNHLKLLQDKVEGNSMTVNSTIDPYLWRGKFSDKVTNGPFYIWNYKDHKREFINLLKGEPVTLYADINRTSPEMTAIKFNRIELQIRSTDPIIQSELAETLKGIRVEMQHSGLSHYRLENKVYQMSNDNGFCVGFEWGDEGKKPQAINQVYTKMKNGDFMLSPYTNWRIQLSGGDIFKKFENQLDTIQIHLVGKGQYVLARNAEGKVNLDQYAENISI